MNMSCPPMERIEAYLDNELPERDDQELAQHLAACHACATAALGARKLKAAIRRTAGATFVPSADFQARIRRTVSPQQRRVTAWLPAFALATAAVIVLLIGVKLQLRPNSPDLLAEVTDLHVSTLASVNPVDVISTDRHTVKPWFEGKLPFTFDLPDLQNSEFHLIGGRMAYVAQSPGAELLFGIRKHQVSAFIFQDRERFASLGAGPSRSQHLAFNLETWSDRGLRYVVVSDTSAADVKSLANLMRSARQ